MNKFNRTTLENRAARVGYTLSEASRATIMRAVANGEKAPKWELNHERNQYADRVIGCGTLAEVADRLNKIEITDQA